jgi:tRNA threonylcarbamoyladenosine biosynthesis protein TsaB
MLILSLETSTHVCSVALHKEAGSLLAYAEILIDKSHAEKITIPDSQNFAKKAQIGVSDIDAVAISRTRLIYWPQGCLFHSQRLVLCMTSH